jgi:hypothetical protein
LFLSFCCHCRTTSVGKLRHFSALTGMLRRSFAVLVGDDSYILGSLFLSSLLGKEIMCYISHR